MGREKKIAPRNENGLGVKLSVLRIRHGGFLLESHDK
jgi:hypothetical protein